MGGAVSSGRDNNELIDNLMGGNYIRTRDVERVFRALDRAEYMTPDGRDQAYKDLAWRNGPLHMSAPCIYSEVLEGLEVKKGLSFLNVGSGTGYFSTLVGLLLGSSGINHGIEVHPTVVEYAIKKLGQFIENSPTLDEFDFCEPKFYSGNALCLAPLQAPYDRVYCGASCPEEYKNYFEQLIKVGGILVMPLNDNLVQVRRTAVDAWTTRNLLNVSFATLREPTKEEAADPIRLEEQTPVRLQLLCRSVVRHCMRASLMSRHPALREPPPRAAPPPNACPRRICIPIEDDTDVEGLNAYHDLDNANGANEMNALLSLVLSMGQNRVAGAIRFDSLTSSSDDSDEDGDDNDNDGDDDPPDNPDVPPPVAPRPDVPPPVAQRPDVPPPVAQRPDVPPPVAQRPDVPPPVSPRPDVPPAVPPRPEWTTRAKDTDRSDEDTQDEKTRSRTCRGLLTFEFDRDAQHPRGSSSSDNSAGDRKHGQDKGTKRNDSSKKGCTHGVPSEVEIYLGKEMAGTSSSEGGMVWEAEGASSKLEDSGEENTDTSKKDSGIGEGTTASSGSSPGKSECVEDELDTHARRASTSSGEFLGRAASGRRLLNKRAHCAARRSSSSCSGSESDASGGAGAGRARKRRASGERAPRRPGPDARRVRLSIMMKRGVKELPLPYALKKYVNWGRCFEF